MAMNTPTQRMRIVVPEAPAVVRKVVIGNRRPIRLENLRIGVLDNGKANADQLLKLVEARLRAVLPVRSSVSLRKAHVGMKASPAFIKQLSLETDFVVSAMAE